MNAIRVLVAADATSARDEVIATIEQDAGLELTGAAASPSQVLSAIRDTQPEVILIDETLNDTSTLSLMEDLAARHPDLTVVAMIHEGHVDLIRQVMFAGARAFVTLPLSDGELPQVLGQIRRLELTRQTGTPSVARVPKQRAAEGKVVAIYSPKGGVGKTTLAANLGVTLARQAGGRVALVDGNPQFGHLGLVLNVHGNYSVLDLLARVDDLESDLIDGMLASHASGVQVLLAPTEIERADAFPPQSMSKLLAKLQTLFDWVIVDSWPVLTESTLDILEAANRVLLLLIPDITCLRDTKQFLDLVDSLNYPLNKFDIIVNRATDGGLDRVAIEEGLKRKVVMEIPQDDPLVTHSLNRGIPLVISHKRSPVAKAVVQLADWIAAGSELPTMKSGLRAKMRSVLSPAG